MFLPRRDFVKSGAAALAFGLPGRRLLPPPDPDQTTRDLCLHALDAARAAGASYADIRISRTRTQSVSTREQQITGVSESDTEGFGIRVLADGAWGFAASRELTRDEITRIARTAVALAKANRAAMKRPVTLSPTPAVKNGRWRSPVEIDPFSVSLDDKVTLLLAANAAALKVKGARFVSSSLSFELEEKTFASTDDIFTVQAIYRTAPELTVTAVDPSTGDYQSRSGVEAAPTGFGYEAVLKADLAGQAPRWAEEAVRKLSAKPVEPGKYDLILEPHHLWLTIHESIAHPTEFDRALGYEANYAGTSFLSPPEKVLGKLRYGPEFMNIQGDRSQEGTLAACGWDDDGVAPETYHLIRNGIVVDYQTTRDQVEMIRPYTGRTRSHGCSYAQSWGHVQFQRMPNISLMPGEQDLVLDDLVAATERGILVVGDSSYSIDQQRYNFQFTGQALYEVKGGKVVGMLKDGAYQARTLDFWNSMDMIGGPRSYAIN
ncbi:MAG: TldD/PmbA family protein, partial [Gemmatimonadota bacterium]|nr:TldD/PmbA family protein [Gemmatimonadota bacterium]